MEASHHYSRALDELFWLRSLASYEADVLEAHLSLKSFPKSRREHAEAQVSRLRQVAEGRAAEAYEDAYERSFEFRRQVGGRTLTRQQFEAEETA